MSPTQTRIIALSDEQLDEVLGLVGGSDSIELKVTVPDSDRRSTVDALGMDALDAQIRQVFFFDTPEVKDVVAGKRPSTGSSPSRSARSTRRMLPPVSSWTTSRCSVR
jgi:hypothetical protein